MQVSPLIHNNANGPSHLSFLGLCTSTCDQIGAVLMSEVSGPLLVLRAVLTWRLVKRLFIPVVAFFNATARWNIVFEIFSFGRPILGSALYTSRVGTKQSIPTSSLAALRLFEMQPYCSGLVL